MKNDKFDEALDIYSQFFKDPLFTESCVDREINAVDNEYRKNLSLESRALYAIEKNHIARPGSILDRFGTGCSETLSIPGIMKELKSFYKENYSSNLMSLVLVGKHSLDEMERMAKGHFHEVFNKNL